MGGERRGHKTGVTFPSLRLGLERKCDPNFTVAIWPWLSTHRNGNEGKVCNRGNREETRRWVQDERGNRELELACVWEPKGQVLPFPSLSWLPLFPLPGTSSSLPSWATWTHPQGPAPIHLLSEAVHHLPSLVPLSLGSSQRKIREWGKSWKASQRRGVRFK